MTYKLSYKHISPNILEICWPAAISKDILLQMMTYKKKIISLWYEELWDVHLGYHCLSLNFKEAFSLDEVIGQIEDFGQEEETHSILHRKRWQIPVLYQGKDLSRIAKITQLSVNEVIEHHHKSPYLLHFFGFMPGFMYLGGLSKKLFAPRKDQPDPKIQKGSVAIGGKQTGIYPMDSPGGWNILGLTPVKLFDLKQQPPISAQPGDEIKFYSIDKKEFERVSKSIYNQNYSLEYEII
ncbi:carboxyltransferase domain-containing protein [Echinicola marina]|uniref:5-oxoprolinase subunit B family protein n=1 Tax=Echinicola marina TaxID=2859768 RepID=UPI001CF6A69C|nr:carboxyltransferase domain-containing protein [Echinicola marina]UCS92928.1 carboxyltransferase domain-containing protein [Echinicola marina]